MDREDARLIIYHVTHYDKFRNHIKYVLNFFLTVSSQTWQYYKLYFNSRPELHLLAQRKQFLDKHTHSQTHTYTHTLTHTHPKSVICIRGEITKYLKIFMLTPPSPYSKHVTKKGEWVELGATTGVNSWEWLRDLDLLIFRDFSFCILKGGCTRYEVEHI